MRFYYYVILIFVYLYLCLCCGCLWVLLLSGAMMGVVGVWLSFCVLVGWCLLLVYFPVGWANLVWCLLGGFVVGWG